MGFLRQEYWSELPFPSPGDLPDPGIKPCLLHLQAGSLPSEPPGKPSGQKAEAMAWNGAEHGLWRYRRGTGRGARCQPTCCGVEVTLVSERSVGCGKIEVELLLEALHLISLDVEFYPPIPTPSPGEGSSKSWPSITGQLNNFTSLEKGLRWLKTPPACVSSSTANSDEPCVAPGHLWSLEKRLGGVFPPLRGLKSAQLHLLLSDFFCWTFPSSSGGDYSAVFSQRPWP